MRKAAILSLAFLGSLSLFPGCSRSAPTRFYLLRSIAPELPERAAARTEGAVAVGPVKLPEYLDRPQIVTRADSGTQVVVAEFDRWAEPLADGIKRVVVQNLAVLLPATSVHGFPAIGEVSADFFQVSLQVERLDAAPGSATLEVWWSILDARGATVSPPTRFQSAIRVVQMSYDAFVSAESQALGQLSREVAAKLHEIGAPAARGPRP